MKQSYPTTDQIDHQCPECGGTMQEQIIKHEQHDPSGVFYIVENVPASVCKQCGSIYLEAVTLKQLDQIIKTSRPLKKIETPTSIFDFVKSRA